MKLEPRNLRCPRCGGAELSFLIPVFFDATLDDDGRLAVDLDALDLAQDAREAIDTAEVRLDTACVCWNEACGWEGQVAGLVEFAGWTGPPSGAVLGGGR